MTFLDIINRIRSAIDDPDDILFALDRKKQAINDEATFLFSKLSEYDFNFGNNIEIDVVSGTQEYNLPADFDLARAVYEEGYPEELWECCDRNEKNSQDGDDRYYITGIYSKINGVESFRKIGIVPKPTRNFTLIIEQIPKASNMIADTDVPPIPSNYHELLVLGGLIRLAGDKNFQDLIGEWRYRYNQLYVDLINHISSPQRGQSKYIKSKIAGVI